MRILLARRSLFRNDLDVDLTFADTRWIEEWRFNCLNIEHAEHAERALESVSDSSADKSADVTFARAQLAGRDRA